METPAHDQARAALQMARDRAWPHLTAEAVEQIDRAIAALDVGGISARPTAAEDALVERRVEEAMVAIHRAWMAIPIQTRMVPGLTVLKRAVREALVAIARSAR